MKNVPVDESAAQAAEGRSTALVPLNTAARPAPSTTRQRDVLLLTAVAVGASLVTFATMSSRGGPSPTLAAAAPADAAPARAAVKPAAASAAQTAASSSQKWNADNRVFWLGKQRGAAFELLSENSVQTWFGPAQPALVVRCTSRSIETFVYTRTPLKIEPRTDGRTVTVSVDDEPLRTERWTNSDGRDALFAPDSDALARRLLQARSFRFGYSPHNSSDVVAQFSVAGLAELIEPAAKECGWKK